MESNAEIRQRMNTYRRSLLFFNWLASILGVISGFELLKGTGFGDVIIIISILLGIIGHFLINVALAIPFILLNNGDILDTMKRDMENNT